MKAFGPRELQPSDEIWDPASSPPLAVRFRHVP